MDFATSALGSHRLRKIAGMSVAEMRYRGRQAGSKLIDRLRPTTRRDPRARLRRHAPRLADPRVAVECLRDRFERRFFKGVAADVIATIRSQHASHVDQIVAHADRLMAGRFDLLGYRDLHFGDPIDWHLDPVWGRRTPLRHWSKIDPLDPALVGDSKVVWELNRHQWMVTLAQATVLTGDDRYARHALSAMRDWIDANPTGRGINWSSSLEVAFRLISWTWVLALLRGTTLLESNAAAILASIHAHAAHVQRYLSQYYSPNTHLTGEALGLFYAGTLYPEFDDAVRWRETGATTLIEQAWRQVSPDGVYFEQSACYQRYTRDIYRHFAVLAERNSYAVPSHVSERLERVEEFIDAIELDDHSLPAIGDHDGGWLLPLSPRSTDAAVEMLWLTGAPDRRQRIPKQSQLFREGGYAVLQSGPHRMIVDAGPLGAFGHGHADLLSVECSIFGERCIVDSGTYGYTAEPDWRDYFRSTAAHNTITIDGLSQAIPNGPFGWQQRPAATINKWELNGDADIIEAQHDAFPGVTHRRRVMSVPGAFVVIDDLIGEGQHTFELTFQFAPMTVQLLSGTTARAITPNGRSLLIMPFTSTQLHAEIVTGRINPPRGWVSEDYGQRTPAPALIYSAHVQLPATIVTILQPESDSNEPCAVLPEF